MKHPNFYRQQVPKKKDKYDLVKELNGSKSLLANVIDGRTREFVLNDDFGIIRSILITSIVFKSFLISQLKKEQRALH